MKICTREQQNEGLSLNEILSKFKIRKWNKKDGKKIDHT